MTFACIRSEVHHERVVREIIRREKLGRDTGVWVDVVGIRFCVGKVYEADFNIENPTRL